MVCELSFGVWANMMSFIIWVHKWGFKHKLGFKGLVWELGFNNFTHNWGLEGLACECGLGALACSWGLEGLACQRGLKVSMV
jgi:hypothetical protein